MSFTEKEIDELLDLESEDDSFSNAAEKKSLDFEDEDDLNIGNTDITRLVKYKICPEVGDIISFVDCSKNIYGEILELLASGEIEGSMHGIKLKFHADKDTVAIIKCLDLINGEYVSNGKITAYPLQKLSKDTSDNKPKVIEKDMGDIEIKKAIEDDEFNNLFPSLQTKKRSKKKVLSEIDSLLDELRNLGDEELEDL